jgi:hypothetical protein
MWQLTRTTKKYQQNMRYITKEDRTVAALTMLSVIALIGVAMLPGAVVDDADGWWALGTYMASQGASWQSTAAVGIGGLYHATLMGAAFGTAFGPGVGTAVGAGLGL